MNLEVKISYPNVVNFLECDVVITNPANNRTAKVKGFWDTGASHCNVSPKVVEQLDLVAVDTGRTLSMGRGNQELSIYLVSFTIQNSIFTIKASEFEIGEGYDCIIGMGIISHGDFRVLNQDGKTTLSFSVIK